MIRKDFIKDCTEHVFRKKYCDMALEKEMAKELFKVHNYIQDWFLILNMLYVSDNSYKELFSI